MREDALAVLTAFFALHVLTALIRGGRLRYFLWPFNFVWLIRRFWQGGLYRQARAGLWNAVAALRLPYYFRLGVRGFVGALLWLVVPLALLGLAHKSAAVGILGAELLALAILYVPFLQTRFARDNRFRAFLELGAVRRDFRRAPLAFALVLCLHLLFAVPLYVFKIEYIPRDLVFLEGFVFLMFIFPARLLDGWAYARCYTAETQRRGALEGWLHHYNHHRPHTACANQPPFMQLTNVPDQYT